MSYRQLLTDVGLAVLLAAPTLALAEPSPSPSPNVEVAEPAPAAQILADRLDQARPVG